MTHLCPRRAPLESTPPVCLTHMVIAQEASTSAPIATVPKPSAILVTCRHEHKVTYESTDQHTALKVWDLLLAAKTTDSPPYDMLLAGALLA